ncbi:Imm52 family immunity protein [Xanthomonas oryzae pv. oryzicola]|uniref:Imm52 family immunity protein n=1 Tax=Xanthomonas oryzae TaxID=347 RepID=UPI001E3C6D35|nr:Imm52 family immunity protein [Xanthomonas oryzae]
MSYQFDKKLFPHRHYFGWMGFVPVELSHAQIRDADEVVPVPGKGAIIVSVPGLLDPADPAQVEQAHRVEMQLAHYNLLPVTDPDLRGAP